MSDKPDDSFQSRLDEALEIAMELHGDSRETFLRGLDPEIRKRVQSMISALERAGSDFLKPLSDAVVPSAESTGDGVPNTDASFDPTRPDGTNHSDEIPGAGRISGLRYLRKLGEGGMGSVFLCHQEPPLDRHVAVKVIGEQILAQTLLTRFNEEQRSNSLLDHPHIARVYNAGLTDRGLPWLSMEFVDGCSITTYADRHRLSIPDRIALVETICRAIQHAHQKGIIHRDIKPSNVLVTDIAGTPVVKVIDFGLARTIEADDADSDQSRITEHGQVLGTLR